MNNHEHQRTNPQRAIDEYKKNTPSLIKLGQGRTDSREASETSAYLVMGLAVVMLMLFIGLCFGLPR